MSEQFEGWDESSVRCQEVSIAELDEAVTAYQEARAEYEAKKKESNAADAVQKEKKRQLIELMKAAGKSNWEVEGIGKAIITNRFQVTTPKSIDQKVEMLKYFRSLGEETYLAMVGVNSQTLNAYYNEQVKQDPDFELPGVEAPTHMENIQFRRKK